MSERVLPDPAEVERPWLESYPPGVPTGYDYPEVALTRLLDDAAKDFPEVEAVHFLGYSLTYRELLDQVDRFAAALANLGVRPGDRVALLLPICPQHVVALFAVLRLGAVVSEHDPSASAVELERQLNDSGARVVICHDTAYPRLAGLKGRLSSVEHIIATGLRDTAALGVLGLLRRRGGERVRIDQAEGVLRMRELILRTGPTVQQPPISPQDLAALLYSPDQWGSSRAIKLTHRNLIANTFQSRLWLPDVQAGRENLLCLVPFWHAYGLTLGVLLGVLSAATLTLLPTPDPSDALRTIERRRPTLLAGIPRFYAAVTDLSKARKYDLTSLRICLSGSGELSEEVATRFGDLTGARVRQGYGRTECTSLTHANPIYGRAKPGSVGLPVPDTTAVLLDPVDETRLAAPGEPGQLAIAGPQVTSGYWRRPEETARTILDGWFLTGDIARMDYDGYFEILRRGKSSS